MRNYKPSAIQFLFSFVFLFLFSCQETGQVDVVLGDDGIYTEAFESSFRADQVSNGDNPYNVENEIYKPLKEFIFDYVHIDPNGVKCKFGLEGYRVTPLDSINHQTIMEASFWVDEYMTSFASMDDYAQSEMKYEYYLPNRKSIFPKHTSGLIENNKNIWMHPFRSPYYFRMHNVNPYPFVQFPLEIGKKWEWAGMKVGGSTWSNPDWKSWEGSAEFTHEYEVAGKEILDTNFGNLECWVIEANGTSRIGNTGLTTYFNEEYGFVQMKFDNINKSKTIFKLTEIQERKEEPKRIVVFDK